MGITKRGRHLFYMLNMKRIGITFKQWRGEWEGIIQPGSWRIIVLAWGKT